MGTQHQAVLLHGRHRVFPTWTEAASLQSEHRSTQPILRSVFKEDFYTLGSSGLKVRFKLSPCFEMQSVQCSIMKWFSRGACGNSFNQVQGFLVVNMNKARKNVVLKTQYQEKKNLTHASQLLKGEEHQGKKPLCVHMINLASLNHHNFKKYHVSI